MPPTSVSEAGLAGVASGVTIAILGLLTQQSGHPWLAASFGASCVLVFLAPDSPFSQPASVVGGHLCTTFCGLVAASFLPREWWSVGLAVGCGITAMTLLRVTHPPAGGNPVLAMAAAHWSFLLTPMLAGSLVIVVAGRLLRWSHCRRAASAITAT